jgi:hypothetical protein
VACRDCMSDLHSRGGSQGGSLKCPVCRMALGSIERMVEASVCGGGAGVSAPAPFPYRVPASLQGDELSAHLMAELEVETRRADQAIRERDSAAVDKEEALRQRDEARRELQESNSAHQSGRDDEEEDEGGHVLLVPGVLPLPLVPGRGIVIGPGLIGGPPGMFMGHHGGGGGGFFFG